MQPGAIVEHFDVLKDGTLGLISRCEVLVMDQLVLEGAEKAFSDRVVVTVCLSAHAGNQAVSMQCLAIATIVVLHSLVRMVN